MPIVQSRPAYRLFTDVKAQGADEVQPTAGGGTGAGDIAAVLGNFRFDQYDIQHVLALLFHAAIIVFQNPENFNSNLVEKSQKIQISCQIRGVASVFARFHGLVLF